MTKHICYALLAVASSLLPTALAARDVTPEEALAKAQDFYTSQLRLTRGTAAAPQLTLVSPHNQRSATAAPGFYVFNAEDGRGFVIVAAEDRARTILGYAPTGSFSYTGLPVQLAAFLDGYDAQVAALRTLPEASTATAYGASAATPHANALPEAVAPILGDIVWNQDAPFNRLCPTDRTYNFTTPAGCVAVAAAQIMRHYKYPARGKGERTYTTDTERINLSANFGETTYDWDNMLADYNYGSSEAQADAVATLVYQVGVGCKMDYNYEGSGATAKEIAKAFTRYFDYDTNIEYIDRTHYDEPSWEALLRSEVAAGRPVLEFGEGTGGGHAFVCDGYDANGLFHYNWGWGGMSNGYYQSSALEPQYLGIGSGLGAYNYLQAALTNIQPPTTTSTHVAGLQLAAALTPAEAETPRDGGQTVTAAFYNYGLRHFTGEVAAALCHDDGSVVTVLASKQVNNLAELSGGTKGTKFTFTVPADVADGAYRLCLVHKEEGATAYTAMRAPVNAPNWLDVNVGASVTYALPAFESKLSLTEAPKVLTALYNGRRASFSVTVHNDGEEYYSYLGILLQRRDVTGTPVRQYVGVILTRVPKGATRTFTYTADSLTVPAGSYDIVAVADLKNANSSYLDAIEPENPKVTQGVVRSRPIFGGNFQLTGPLTVVTEDGAASVTANSLFSVKAPLTNKGGYADGKFALIFFNRAEENIGNSTIVDLSLAAGGKATLDIAHVLNVDPGQYGVVLASVEGNKATAISPSNYNALTFYVVAPTGIGNVETAAPRIAVAVSAGQMSVVADKAISRLDIYDTAGRRVHTSQPAATAANLSTAGWAAGTYIVSATTAAGHYTEKVSIGK